MGVAKSRIQLSDFTFTFHFHALEKEMATHSSVLAWGIPGMAEPGGLPSMGLHRVRHDWSDLAAAPAALFLWTKLFIPGINPTWSWCWILFISLWIWIANILLRNFFVCVYMGYCSVTFFMCDVFFWFWYRHNASLLEGVGKCLPTIQFCIWIPND